MEGRRGNDISKYRTKERLIEKGINYERKDYCEVNECWSLHYKYHNYNNWIES